MHIAQEGQAVSHIFQVFRALKMAIGHRIIEDETRAANQVTCDTIIDASIILEEMIKAAAGVDAAGIVKCQRIAYMFAQCDT